MYPSIDAAILITNVRTLSSSRPPDPYRTYNFGAEPSSFRRNMGHKAFPEAKGPFYSPKLSWKIQWPALKKQW